MESIPKLQPTLQPEFDIPRIDLNVSVVPKHPDEAISTLIEASPSAPESLRISNREGSMIAAETQAALLDAVYVQLDYGTRQPSRDGKITHAAFVRTAASSKEGRLASVQLVSDEKSDEPIGAKVSLYGDKADTVYEFSRVVDQFVVTKSVEKHIKAKDVETGAAMNGLYKAASKRRRAGKDAGPVWLEEQAARELVDLIDGMRPVDAVRE